MQQSNSTLTIEQDAQKIIACIDGSSVTQAVCDYSTWFAKKSNLPIKLLHTIEHQTSPAVSDLTGAIGLGSQQELLNELAEVEQTRSALLIKKGQILLQAAKDRILELGGNLPEIVHRHGGLSDTLIELEHQTGMIIMGVRGEAHEDNHQGVGHQLESVIRSMQKPILVVTNEFSEPKNLMLAYDASDCCEKALKMIAESDFCKNLPCHLVHVGNKATDKLVPAANQLKAAGIEVFTCQLQGNIEQALLEYQTQNQIDLMLMGAFSHNRFRDFLLGSFTAKMLAASKKPLLLLR